MQSQASKKTRLVAAALLLIGNLVSVAGAQSWNYLEVDSWPGECSTGQSQSPINLVRLTSVPRKAEPFKFDNYDNSPEWANIANKGKTVKLTAGEKDNNQLPMVSGGDLPGKYAFGQFHLHWGMTNNVGSEHTFENTSFPLELHLVHYNTKYSLDLKEAIAVGNGAQDTLAVLGVMFQLQAEDNPKVEMLLKFLPSIQNYKENEMILDKFAMSDFLPEDTSKFYRYNGSLTTPGCNEIVVWTVFKTPLGMSQTQLDSLRALAKVNPNMQNNFRPVQPLNKRRVQDIDTSTGSADKDDDDGSSGVSFKSSLKYTALASLVAWLQTPR